jgi:hypothetical protein
LELAALVADNKVSHAQKTIGPTSRSWPLANRRDAIIASVRARWTRERMQPVGSYPPAPDPVYTTSSSGWQLVGWIDPGDLRNIGRPS